ncbi:Myocardin-related transcription factor B [Geodia barretti]|uniref:Myocardin-related transcription factor B n=1 Tax=Geodia barretti TaxID=519541 RepID=A0AA35TNG4_GEOBA|nr:Myocardin-related transcription factor B [Geodia barretti]
MAANDRQSSPTDFLLELTSPQSSVDTSTQDRMTVQQELEKKLRARAVREDLVQKNILPDFSSSPILFQQTKELQKKKNADCLQRKLRNRPERQNLMQMNILPGDMVDPGLASKQMMLKKNKLADELNRKIARRPGPLELIKGRILVPDNHELSEVVPDVMRMFEQEEAGGKTSPSDRGELQYQGASSLTSPLGEGSPPSKDVVTSPLSDTSVQPQSPEEMPSPLGRSGMRSPPFNLASLIPPSPMPQSAMNTPGIMAPSHKVLSPSQARKKQQKQKYRKLRYHEYVPPTKNNGKGGKTNPKPLPKQETPYSHILQQQQLFLQLQVLQQQYPNGVLMQKLPDIVDSLTKTSKAGKGGKDPSPSGVGGATGGGGVTVQTSVPQVVMVEQPNQYQVSSIRFEELKVSDLKAACKEMGMIVSGKKAELVERLIEHNNGYLPAIALPETQTRDPQRAVSGRAIHPSMLDPQVSMSGYSPPSPTSSSPVFKFPGDHGPNSSDAGVGRKGSLSSLSSMGAPQVIPAHTLQQQFDELVERQKRSYICQGQAPKSLAPRPELGDMVAIKFPCPVDTQSRGGGGRGGGVEGLAPQQRSGKGTTLPRQGSGGSNAAPESRMAVSPFGKQSHSLPSSPQPLSPSDSATRLIGELMEDSSEQPRSLQVHSCSGAAMGVKGEKATPPQHPHSQQPFMSSAAPTCSSGAATSNGLPFSGAYSQTNHHAPLMATSSYYSQHGPSSSSKPPLRQSQSISSVPIHGRGASHAPAETTAPLKRPTSAVREQWLWSHAALHEPHQPIPAWSAPSESAQVGTTYTPNATESIQYMVCTCTSTMGLHTIHQQ